MDEQLRIRLAKVRSAAQKVVAECDALLKSYGKSSWPKVTGSAEIVYRIAYENRHQGRVTRKRIVKKATPLIEQAYPNNQSVEQTIQNALARLVKKGLLAKTGFGGYRVVA